MKRCMLFFMITIVVMGQLTMAIPEETSKQSSYMDLSSWSTKAAHLWSRLKAAISGTAQAIVAPQNVSRAGKTLGALGTAAIIHSPEDPNVVSVGASMAGAGMAVVGMSKMYKSVQERSTSSFLYGAGLSGLGAAAMISEDYPGPKLLALTAGGVFMVIAETIKQLYEMYSTASTFELVQAAKISIEAILNMSDGFPTTQTKLDAIDHVIKLKEKDTTPEARIYVSALNAVKNDIIKGPLYQQVNLLKQGADSDNVEDNVKKISENLRTLDLNKAVRDKVYQEALIDIYVQDYYRQLAKIEPGLIGSDDALLLKKRIEWMNQNAFKQRLDVEDILHRRQAAIQEEIQRQHKDIDATPNGLVQYKAFKAIYKDLQREQQLQQQQ